MVGIAISYIIMYIYVHVQYTVISVADQLPLVTLLCIVANNC